MFLSVGLILCIFDLPNRLGKVYASMSMRQSTVIRINLVFIGIIIKIRICTMITPFNNLRH